MGTTPQRPQEISVPMSPSSSDTRNQYAALIPPPLVIDHGFSPLKSPNPASLQSSQQIGSPSFRFSTPTGPPAFTSPLRHVPIPFRSSPATPQRVDPPSDSSLPSSSTPFFSDESTEIASQVARHSLSHNESIPVIFSAQKVLKQKKLANALALGFGALFSPGKSISSGVLATDRIPHCCKTCGAYSNLYCEILMDSGNWKCVICGNLNGSKGEYAVLTEDALNNFPELTSPMINYVDTGKNWPGHFPPAESQASLHIMLVIDESLDETDLRHLQSSLHGLIDALPQTARIGIMLYGRVVSVCDFSEGSVASTDVIPGKHSPSQESLYSLLCGTGMYLTPVHASKEVAHKIISSLRPFNLKLPEDYRERCLGTAVEVALFLLRDPSAEMPNGIVKKPGSSNRIVVCAGGPCTCGPGSVPHLTSHPHYAHLEKAAVKWMNQLGHSAHQQNTVVDILCAGTCPVRVPVLHGLSSASGGTLILHDDFGADFGSNLQKSATRTVGFNVLSEIRCSDEIVISQVVGSTERLRHSHNYGFFKNEAVHRIQIPTVEETRSLALFLEHKRDIKSDHVFFQFVVHFSNIYQTCFARVITMRLPTVDSTSQYLDSVHDEVAAVLIAKRIILRAKTRPDSAKMASSIDERVKDLALTFGPHVLKSSPCRFPRELPLLPEILFHLKRGPLLGSIVCHEDERFVIRNLFLFASFDLSIRMVAPKCVMYCDGGTFEELPAYDTVMQSDKAIVLDHGTHVFIWLGAKLAATEELRIPVLAACRIYAEELTEQRFPTPRILTFKEGSSEARYFVPRLIPAHKDTPYEQEARFPQLRTLTVEQRMKLKNSFIQFDDPSFLEWMRALKVVPPEPVLQ